MHRRSGAGDPPLSSAAVRTLVLQVALLAGVLFAPSTARSQTLSYGVDRPRAVQSMSFAYQMVDFRYDGTGAPEPSFEYEGPAYGVFYTRPNFAASLVYGKSTESSDADMRLLDASLTTWGELRLTSGGAGAVYVPIALHTDYRRVAPRGLEDSIIGSFNITVIGLGAGLGGTLDIGERVRLLARATPVIGLALRAFGDSAGSSRLVDAAAHLHVMQILDRFGLSAGYAFRSQVWNVGSSELLSETQDDLLDYAGRQHVVTLGFNW